MQGQQGRSHLVSHDVEDVGLLGRHGEYLVQWTANMDRKLRLNYERERKKEESVGEQVIYKVEGECGGTKGKKKIKRKKKKTRRPKGQKSKKTR